MKVLFLIFIFVISQAIAQEAFPDCQHLTGADYYQQLASKKYWLLFYYIPGCSHQIKFIPIWNEAVRKHGNSIPDFAMGAVNCNKEKKLCDAIGMFGFPSLYFMERSEFVTEYPNDRNIEQLSDFIVSWTDPENKMEGWLKRQEVLDRLKEEKAERKRLKKLQQNKNDL